MVIGLVDLLKTRVALRGGNKHMSRLTFVSSVAILLLTMSVAKAELLGVTLLPAPDITSGFIQVDYDASESTFMADGFALTLETPPAEPPPDFTIDDGTFNIT
jgi:hypothetical protein